MEKKILLLIAYNIVRMKVLVEVNLQTIQQGKSDLLLLEAKDFLEKDTNILSKLIQEQNSLHQRVSEIEAFLVL